MTLNALELKKLNTRHKLGRIRVCTHQCEGHKQCFELYVQPFGQLLNSLIPVAVFISNVQDVRVENH